MSDPTTQGVRARGESRFVSDATTKGIRVHVESRFVPEQSFPHEPRYFFAYHITISNLGEETAQLISRHWIITDADGEVEEVEGPGVVGKQPMLEPGASFEYTSFCPLKTNVGTMHGTYTMVTSTGTSFEARIAPFTLASPNALN
jgi:ApaG protein